MTTHGCMCTVCVCVCKETVLNCVFIVGVGDGKCDIKASEVSLR